MIKNIRPALAEGGKIKIGGLGGKRLKRGGDKSNPGDWYRLPVKYSHFLVTSTARDDAGDFVVDMGVMESLRSFGANGGEAEIDRGGRRMRVPYIREIPIILHSDEIDEVFPTAYAMYSGRKLACRGDGETATRWKVQAGVRTDETKQMACPCEFLGAKGRTVCKPHGVLHCSINVQGHAVAGAVHKWRTTSLISVQQMIGSLQQVLHTVGTLRGIPLVLRLDDMEVSPEGASSTVYVCHVELRARDVQEVQRQALEAANLRAQVGAAVDYRALVSPPAGDDEDDEEQSDVGLEFHPEPDQTAGDLKSRLKQMQANRAARSPCDPEAEPPHDLETGEVVETDAREPGDDDPDEVTP